MTTVQYPDVAQAPDDHNTSAQHNVVENDDPALQKSHEHAHGHLHHDQEAAQGKPEEVIYSRGTTFEKSTIPHQDPQDHDLARRRHTNSAKPSAAVKDAEKGDMSPEESDEEDPRTHTLSNFYAKYRIFFHLFIWLFFTGYVGHDCMNHGVNNAPVGGLQASFYTTMILSRVTLGG